MIDAARILDMLVGGNAGTGAPFGQAPVPYGQPQQQALQQPGGAG